MRSIPGANTHTQSLPDGSDPRTSSICPTTSTRSRPALKAAMVATAILLGLLGLLGLLVGHTVEFTAQSVFQPAHTVVADTTPSVPCGGTAWPC